MTQQLEHILERASRLSGPGQKTAVQEFKKIIARIESEEQNGHTVPSEKPDYSPFPVTKRVAGLGKGTVHMAPDFDDPLPDSFWLGEE